jgi:hypothetical protein
MGAQDGDMAEIVNLRQVKKRGERQDAAAQAQQNRVRHGRTKAEKANDVRALERREAAMDALRRDDRG